MINMIFTKRLCLVVFLLVATATNVNAAKKINVFVSILPQQYFVQQVGGEHVNVHVMVGPGLSPETYEPTPQQMAALANADIYFSIGVSFEKAWLDKIRQSNKELIVIECCDQFSDLHEHSHDDNNIDPHIWTSPKKAIQITKLVEKSLKEIDENNSGSYEVLASNFIAELDKLDSTIKSKLSTLKQKSLIVSHPSWGYFADEYGLTQISIEQKGKEIQAKSMVNLIKLAKEKNIKAVFVQSQFNNKAARIIAKEIDAVVFDVDPLAFNYIENMNNVTDKIKEGLSYE